MKDLLKFSTARIYNLRDEVVGAGFLVSKTHLVTCAHVVNDAIGLPKGTTTKPNETVSLDFPFAPKVGRVTAKVVRWRAPNFGPAAAESDEEDVAVLVLELKADDAAALRSVRPQSRGKVWNHAFRAFGFPESYDQGVWASGQLKDREANNWIQIEVQNELSYFVAPGFSGTAVEELRRFRRGVVGMVVASDSTPGKGSAFIIPAETLLRICAEIIEPPFWKKRAKLLFVVVTVFLVASFATYMMLPLFTRYAEHGPNEYPTQKTYDFLLSEKATLPEQWNLPSGWDLERGGPANQDDESIKSGALLIKGNQMATPNDLGGKVFYNYTAEFSLRFKAGDKAAWVLRAQSDGQSGYLFELRKEKGVVFIKGWILKNRILGETLPGSKNLLYTTCCNSTDALHIVATVTDNPDGTHIKYDIDFVTDFGFKTNDSGQTDVAEFIDTTSTFRWGTIGLLVTDGITTPATAGGVMRVESITLTPTHRDEGRAVSSEGSPK